MKILTICPSKGRPQEFKNMLDSFNRTKSKNIDMYLMNSCDDNVEKYYELIYHDRIFTGVELDRLTVTQLINIALVKFPDYDFYHLTNDDVIYETPLWDLELSNKGKISYGCDGIQNENLCTFPMIDGDIVRALGWLQLPTLNKYCGDTVWNFIGKQCGILKYCPEVSIHHHWEGCSHPDIHTKDMEEFAKWLPWSFRDVKKVKEALRCQKLV